MREQKLLTLEDTVRKGSGAVAARLGLRDRGLLREGMFADVVIFDDVTILELATPEKPHQISRGVELSRGVRMRVGGRGSRNVGRTHDRAQRCIRPSAVDASSQCRMRLFVRYAIPTHNPTSDIPAQSADSVGCKVRSARNATVCFGHCVNATLWPRHCLSCGQRQPHLPCILTPPTSASSTGHNP